MIPTINDYPSNSIYTDEQILNEVYENFFEGVNKKMCVNKELIEMENEFMAVGYYVAKEYMSYKISYEDKKLKDIYDDVAPVMENYGLKMIDYSLFSKFLKDVHIKGKINPMAKTVLIYRIMYEAFMNAKIKGRIHGAMKADGHSDLCGVMKRMENVFYDINKTEFENLYRKPRKLTEAEVKKKYYRMNSVKNLPAKHYDYYNKDGEKDTGSYEVTEFEPFQDNIDAVIRDRKKRGVKRGNL